VNVRAASGIDPRALLGHWHIAATTLPFWRGKRAPTVTYAERPDGRWSDTLSWYDARGRERRLAGVDRPVGEPGRFVWNGSGLLAILASEWAFVEVADDARWCATWFGRARFGVTPEGMDVYVRDRSAVDVDAVLAGLRARTDLPTLEGWFETERSAQPSSFLR
jgi:hypothetical protein